MPQLNLKPTHQPVKAYYESLNRFQALGVSHEGAVKTAFQHVLEAGCRQFNWTLVPEWQMKRARNRRIIVDGALIDGYQIPHGFWEAKDSHDDLDVEIRKKFDAGYPRDNMLFQAPDRAILWQDNQPILDEDLTEVSRLIETLTAFFEHRPAHIQEWEEAVAAFKDRVPELAQGLVELIRNQRQTNRRFIRAFADFTEKCCQSINPNLAEAAVEEMLIQHLLTERIFRRVFNNPDFTRRNVIASEIEKVIDALTSQSFSREEFLKRLDRFYVAIEQTAATISDFSQKQQFLNTVYEQFFQGYSVKVADTHGIVYTPQPIVDFMVRSVEEILQKEFGRSLSDQDVHIIDPFVGTGNFIVRIMQEIQKTALEHKYTHELHCNEVMLLPYYIASMNFEHEYYQATGRYQPFEGICLVDTFDLAEDRQLSLFAEENTQRVEKQKRTPMFVIIGNPPYNASQVNQNDNNKNRKYPVMDKRVVETYAKDSKATNKNALSDPYVKATRWASDQILRTGEGVVALVTNSSFVSDLAFDGMRQHLAQDFDVIYVLDLGGNVRKNPKLSGTTHNVFGIQVGVSITLFVRKGQNTEKHTEISYACVDKFWRKEDKYRYLNEKEHHGRIDWQSITPDKKRTWLTEGLHSEFETFIAMGSKEARAARGEAVNVIFKIYSRGAETNRDAWAYNFNAEKLSESMQRTIEVYNEHVYRYDRSSPKPNIDEFVINDSTQISWSRNLKRDLKRGRLAEFSGEKTRDSMYRPFTRSYLFFDRVMNQEVGQLPCIFPTPATEAENRVICVTDKGSEKPFMTLMSGKLTDLHVVGAGSSTQCFPFYTYNVVFDAVPNSVKDKNEGGTHRRENITDWSLSQFRTRYQDDSIGKWDIFHYVYALLHHPDYRERYAANLKRELPRIPFAPDFWSFVTAGQRLADIHVHYEDQLEYPLKRVETPNKPLDWRVEKMRLSKDKTQIKYNDFLTLDGIPPKAFDYRLGNRSALDWVIDQYRVKTDKRSGIVNDPNRDDDPRYIVRLIGQVITVSLETVEIVEGLPAVGIPTTSS